MRPGHLSLLGFSAPVVKADSVELPVVTGAGERVVIGATPGLMRQILRALNAALPGESATEAATPIQTPAHLRRVVVVDSRSELDQLARSPEFAKCIVRNARVLRTGEPAPAPADHRPRGNTAPASPRSISKSSGVPDQAPQQSAQNTALPSAEANRIGQSGQAKRSRKLRVDSKAPLYRQIEAAHVAAPHIALSELCRQAGAKPNSFFHWRYHHRHAGKTTAGAPLTKPSGQLL